MTRSLAIFAVVNLALLAITGVHVGGDTGLYLDGARRLLAGQPLVDREPSYFGYVAVVAVSQAIGAGSIGVVLFQIAAATAAAGAIYQLAMELGGGRVAMVATALLTLDIDVNRWHTFVLADSLYISGFALSLWLVHRAASTPRSAWRYLVASLVLIASASIRPEGWFVLPAAGLYWVSRGIDGLGARALGTVAVIVFCMAAALLVAPRLAGNVSAVDPGEMLRRGQTIWDYDGWRIAMPQADSPQSDRVEGPVSYAMHHPMATARLMAARVGVHAAHVRPFYSRAHNLMIVAWLLPIYVLTAIAAWRVWGDPLTRWIALAVATQTVVVALTHADWDGRYLAHVMPAVYPLAAFGFFVLLRRRAIAVRVA